MTNKQDFINAGFEVIDASLTSNQSSNLLELLQEHYPQIIQDGEIKLNELKQALNLPIDYKNNGYGLNFIGRNYAKAKYMQATNKEPKINQKLSKNFNETENVIIKGDNLDSLKILLNSYRGKIKCIYIDPPYNTKNESFIYPDKFDREELEVLGFENINDDDYRRMEFSFSNKSSHNGWLSFIYPRLKLARDLLANDGIIFVSIDDNEQANLKILMDEIFGEENFVGLLSVENNPKGRKNSKYISVTNDYCLIYAKDVSHKNSLFFNNIPKNIDDLTEDNDGNYIHNSGKRVLVGESSNEYLKDIKSDKHYSVYYKEELNDILIRKENKIDHKDLVLLNNGYIRYISIKNNKFLENTYTSNKLIELFQENALSFKDNKIFEKNFNTSIRIKSLIRNVKYKAVLDNREIDFEIDVKTTSAGTFLKTLFNTNKPIFDNSKNVGLVKLLLLISTAPNDLILDFFAGSGTTAQAVMELNKKDGGNRKFILCQIDEPINEEKKKEAFDFCLKNGLEPVISSITIERVKRAGEKILTEIKEQKNLLNQEDKGLDVGFKVFDLIETSKIIEDANHQFNLALSNNDSLSKIYHLILKDGVFDLNAKIKIVIDDCLYLINDFRYYIINAEKLETSENKQLLNDILIDKNKDFIIDGFTASINLSLQQYQNKSRFKIIY